MNYKLKKIFRLILSLFITKKILIGIIILLLILLFRSNVFAYTSSDIEVLDIPSEVMTAFDDIPINNKEDYYYFITYGNGTFIAFFTPKASITTFHSYYAYNNINSPNLLSLIYCPTTPASTWVEYVYNTSTPNNGFIQRYTYTNRDNFVSYNGSYNGTAVLKVYLYTNFDVYTDNTYTTLFYSPPVISVPVFPYISDTDANLTALDMNYLLIDNGDQNVTELILSIYTYILGEPNNSTEIYRTYLNSSSPFYNSNGPNDIYYEIPVSLFKNKLNDGYVVVYRLYYTTSNTEGVEERSVIFTPDLNNLTDTEEIQNTIQNNTNKIINQFSSSITQQTNTLVTQITSVSNKLHELLQQNIQNGNIQADTNNFLKDQNFNNSNLGLPTSNQQDITQDGINNIFTMIYNSFTSGQAPDIVVPVPFTNKSFTIQANFLRNILNNTNFSFVSNIIELFWWYIISRFIITDIANKMNKIKSGDFENLENSNIKEDML